MRELYAGDVAAIPVGVKYWHGAVKDSWFASIVIEVPGENTSNKWLEPVSEEEYRKEEFQMAKVTAGWLKAWAVFWMVKEVYDEVSEE